LPNKVFNSWFKNYFWWWAPSFLLALIKNVRLDWSGIFAYGCKAYVLKREREKGIEKCFFKVIPKGYIGYLVGYRAYNLFRIWVPSFYRVVTTRNMEFDERRFYRKKDKA